MTTFGGGMERGLTGPDTRLPEECIGPISCGRYHVNCAKFVRNVSAIPRHNARHVRHHTVITRWSGRAGHDNMMTLND
jgi:hypothetical protein